MARCRRSKFYDGRTNDIIALETEKGAWVLHDSLWHRQANSCYRNMQLFFISILRGRLKLAHPTTSNRFVTITCSMKHIPLTLWDIASVCPSCGNLHRMLVHNLCRPLDDLQSSLWLLQVLVIPILMDSSCLLSSLVQLSFYLSRAFSSTAFVASENSAIACEEFLPFFRWAIISIILPLKLPRWLSLVLKVILLITMRRLTISILDYYFRAFILALFIILLREVI